MKVKGALRWKLKLVMDKCQIGTVQLADYLHVNKNVVSRWRSYEYVPEINEKRYVQIVAAINHLCDVNGRPGKKIDLWDLIEFCPDELRDFDVVEEHSDSNGRKKQNRGKNNNSCVPESKEESLAAYKCA